MPAEEAAAKAEETRKMLDSYRAVKNGPSLAAENFKASPTALLQRKIPTNSSLAHFQHCIIATSIN
jgi:hypothetical protein